MPRPLIPVLFLLAVTGCTSGGRQDNGASVPQDSLTAAIQRVEQQIMADPANAALYAERARLNEQRDSFALAEGDWERAIAAAPKDPSWYIGLGDLYFRMVQVEDAEERFRKAIEVDPNNVQAHLKLSELYLLKRLYTEAMAEANTALRIDVRNPRGYFLKGWIHMEAGDTVLAISSYQTAIEQDPDLYDAYIALGILHAAKRDPLALHYYNTATELRPRSVEAWYNKGIYLQELGQDSAAFACYDQIKSIDPKNAVAWYNTGYILLEHQRRIGEARSQFTRAITLLPTYPQAYYNRGLTYELEGRLDSALADYQKALALAPSLDLAAQGLSRLQDKGVKVPRPQ